MNQRQTLGSEVLGLSGRPSKRRLVIAVAVIAAGAGLALLVGGVSSAHAAGPKGHVESALIQAAKAAPDDSFKVIVQGDRSERSDKLVRRVAKELEKSLGVRGKDRKEFFAGLRDQFDSINGIAVTLSGRELVKLAKKTGVDAISLDMPVVTSGYGNKQVWTKNAGARSYWASSELAFPAGPMPAIAIVDSGVDPLNGDLGSRVVASVDLTSSGVNSPGDGYGHGTMVASLAAGELRGHSGLNPRAKIVSVDVIDDNGRANTSDVIRACDWILANKDQYNIRVANLSLGASGQSTFRFDPLNRAVERLWFAGITVVVSAGNYGNASGPSGVPLSPANDPFVITVGAVSSKGGPGSSASKDDVAPWTAYGYTNDGFRKPDVGAPGRYMIAAIPGPNSTIGQQGGQNPSLTATGYAQLSGTSFAAPVVAGVAAALLAQHPGWTPNQVKGALMLSAEAVKKNTAGQIGVGEVSVMGALAVASPPNPNAALRPFVTADPAGGSLPVFDQASWASTAASNASWASASWASASWASASWASASWASASWSEASWSEASWSSASWSEASWSEASWSEASWANAAAGDATADPESVDASLEEVMPADAPVG